MTTSLQHRQKPLGLFPGKPAPRLHDRIVEVLRGRHYSRRVIPTFLLTSGVGSASLP
jgi:hypothetical protein